jgi:hypothetical protein
MAKEVTREQAATKKAQAARLMERTGQPDRAGAFRDMSVEEYAEHRGLRLSNPRARRAFMSGETKGELNDKLDEISDLIDESLDSELTREEVIQKIKAMRDVVEAEEEEDAEDDDDSLDSNDEEDD